MKLATEPPAVDVDTAAKPEPAKPAEAGNINMPDLPAMSQTLATQPPKVETNQPVNPPAANAAAEPKSQAPAPAPSAAAAQEPAAQPGAGTTHVVVAGDNYWKLAEALYGDPALWPKIARANPAFRAEALPVGATLKIPAK
jgi:5'-nucleotidase